MQRARSGDATRAFALERDDRRERGTSLVAEAKDVERRIGRLVVALESAGDIASVVAKLRDLEKRRAAIADELARVLLRQLTTQSRAVLQRILNGRIVFRPVPGGDAFEAPTRFDRVFAGVAVPPLTWVPEGKDGTNHIRPEDTLDGDFGQILARA
jgi:hypothetical protein